MFSIDGTYLGKNYQNNNKNCYLINLSAIAGNPVEPPTTVNTTTITTVNTTILDNITTTKDKKEKKEKKKSKDSMIL